MAAAQRRDDGRDRELSATPVPFAIARMTDDKTWSLAQAFDPAAYATWGPRRFKRSSGPISG
jgi:hypothetical protein